jgi:hypothetical protein
MQTIQPTLTPLVPIVGAGLSCATGRTTLC